MINQEPCPSAQHEIQVWRPLSSMFFSMGTPNDCIEVGIERLAAFARG